MKIENEFIDRLIELGPSCDIQVEKDPCSENAFYIHLQETGFTFHVQIKLVE